MFSCDRCRVAIAERRVSPDPSWAYCLCPACDDELAWWGWAATVMAYPVRGSLFAPLPVGASLPVQG